MKDRPLKERPLTMTGVELDWMESGVELDWIGGWDSFQKEEISGTRESWKERRPVLLSSSLKGLPNKYGVVWGRW